MSAAWTSTNGVVLRDLVPAALRRQWVEQGRCPDRDLYTLFGEHVRADPTRVAVVDPDGAIDYTTLDIHVRRVAAALAAAGLGPRDIVGIQVPNGRHAVAAELAVAAVGALALPYPSGRGSRDTLSLLGRSRASAAIMGEVSLATQLTGVRADLPDLRAVFVFGAAPEGCRSLDPWLAGTGADGGWQPVPVDPEAPARVLVSSGSEAEPKMVAYSHNAMAGGRGNYLRALHGADTHLGSGGSVRMRDLVLVPLASSFGSFGASVTIARHGGTLLLPGSFDATTALGMITEHRPTHVFGVPTMLRRLAEQPRKPGEDVSSLRAIVASGATLPATTIQACRARFGCTVINIYGSADGVNCHTAATGCAPGSGVGRPDPAVADLRIVDPHGQPVPVGQEGEICALGPMTPLCYVAAPELDSRYRLPGGWVRTGDRGVLDESGRLHVINRIKQVVLRGGYTISPAEIERQLGAHPAIADVACVAVPDVDLGERLCACVVARPGGPTMALPEINAFLEDERGLERRKLPELLVVLPELPLGPTGKVCRHTLTTLATNQHRLHGGGARHDDVAGYPVPRVDR